MATNLALDDRLIERAVKLGKHKSKKEAVTAALRHYVKSQQREGIKDLVGAIDFDKDFDPKALRRRRSA